MQPVVAIVILNYNGKNYLEKFLPSVLAATYASKRVIVADNASTDDSIEFVKQCFPSVEIIINDKNYGFAEGYNQALKKVEAPYYLLLNSDVEVEPDFIEPVIALMESDKNIAACQPKILQQHNKKYFEYAGACGGWIDAYGYPFSRGRIFDDCEEDLHQYQSVQEVFWATGAAMFVRSEVYNKLNGLDPYFFAHMEEIDLCWRMKLAGYKIMVQPQSVVYHVGGGTLPKGFRKNYLNFRNNYIMLHKNLSFAEKLFKIPLRFLMDWAAAAKNTIGDFAMTRAIIQSQLAYIYWCISQPYKKQFRSKPLSSLSGVYKGSIVWEYFVGKKKNFSHIVEG